MKMSGLVRNVGCPNRCPMNLYTKPKRPLLRAFGGNKKAKRVCVFFWAFVLSRHGGPIQLATVPGVLAEDHGPNHCTPVFDPRLRPLSHQRLDQAFLAVHSDRLTVHS